MLLLLTAETNSAVVEVNVVEEVQMPVYSSVIPTLLGSTLYFTLIVPPMAGSYFKTISCQISLISCEMSLAVVKFALLSVATAVLIVEKAPLTSVEAPSFKFPPINKLSSS
jgi:hypothetical protein